MHEAFGPYDQQDRRMARGSAEGILTLDDLQGYRTEVQPAIDGLRRQPVDVEVRETVLATQLGQLGPLIELLPTGPEHRPKLQRGGATIGV